MKFNKATLKQIDLLSSNYDFDLEKRTVSVPIVFKSAEEMLDKHLSLPGKPKLSIETIDYLQDIVKEIPKEFKINFALKVDDYDDYTHQQLLKSIVSTIENMYYYHDDTRKKYNVVAVIFIIIGVVSLAVQLSAEHYVWFGAEPSIGSSMIIALIEILSWVFIWEGGAILFLTYENDSTLFRQNFHRVNRISFVGKGNKVLSDETQESFNNTASLPGKSIIFTRNYILFSFPFMLAIIIAWSTNIAPQLLEMDIWFKGSFVVVLIMVVLLTISNISFYRGRGLFANWVLPLSCIMFACMILITTSMIIDGDINSLFFIFDCVLLVMVLINIICLIYLYKKRVKIIE